MQAHDQAYQICTNCVVDTSDPTISFNSEADSMLKQWIPYSSAFLIEDLVLATPENTQRFDFPPAAITLSSSPIETTSKPEPSFAKIFKTAKFEFALTA